MTPFKLVLAVVILSLLVGALLGTKSVQEEEVHSIDPRGDVTWIPPTSSTTFVQPKHVTVITSTTLAPRPRSAPSERCGGDLPPCSVMMRESGGDINAYNPTGCNGRGCRGKWQCDPRTCSGVGTEAEQDAEVRALWDNGRGCSHWNACEEAGAR